MRMPSIPLRALALVAVLGLVTLAPAARAVTFLDLGYGTPVDAGTARSAAMGSVGVAQLQGSGALHQNPALLATAGEGWQLDLSFGLTQANEDRFVPLYDTFGDFVAETAIAVNRNTYGFGQGGVVYRLPQERPMAVSIGIHDRYDLDYDYFEEVRDPNASSPIRDTILQFNEEVSDGRLRSLSGGYGAELLPKVHLGFAVHRYFGDLERMRREAPVDDDPTIHTLRRELSGWGWSVGGHVQANERLHLGVSYEFGFTLDGTHTTELTEDGVTGDDPLAPANGDYELVYPDVVTLGLSFQPRNVTRTTFSFEAARRFWEDLENDYAVEEAAVAEAAGYDVRIPALRDTWDFRVGVEHLFYNGMPLRFGFRYLENYADEESYRSIFSAGFAYPAGGGFQLDVTGQYHRQTSSQDYVFDVGDGVFEAPQLLNKVEDSVIRLVLGLSRTF